MERLLWAVRVENGSHIRESERSDATRMSDRTLFLLAVTSMVLALALGIWIGLGYPGLYGKYEKTGRAPRLSPFELLVDWIVRKLDR